jgi:protein-ribulosamine 3-kinase
MQAETWTQIQREIGRALETEVYGQTRVQGGDVNEAYRVELQSGGYVFVKAREDAPPGMFAAEADGLSALDTVTGVRVPRVLAYGDKWLALEWIEAGKRDSKAFDEALGRGVAILHKHRTELGHTRDNFIGVLKQDNTPTKTWTSFFAERRLLPLAKLGVESGKLPPEVERNIEWLCQRLSAFIGDEDAPSQLHGDLWGGNVMCDASGAPVLVDPAVYGGDREVDLAMMRLFGNFSPRVFSAYAEAFPLRPGSDERVRLYQLYPLLVHACMFGGGYVEQVKTLVTALI